MPNLSTSVDPLRQERDQLALTIMLNISRLIDESSRKTYGSDGTMVVEFDSEFELEGRDDVVTAVVEKNDQSTGGPITIITVITKFEDEETSNDLGELGIDDMLNVYEALKEMA